MTKREELKKGFIFVFAMLAALFLAFSFSAKADAASAGNLKTADSKEKEPNQTPLEAMDLACGQKIKGVISMGDTMDVDFYKIYVPERQQVKFSYAAEFTGYFVLRDKDGNEMARQIFHCSDKSDETVLLPGYFDYETVLEEGTYYILIHGFSTGMGSTGRYTLQWQNSSAVPVASVKITSKKKVTAGSSFTLSAAVEPSNATNKSLIWSSSDTGVATVEGGKVTAVNPGAAVITVKASDGSGKQAACKVLVAPKKTGTLKYRAKNRKLQIGWAKQAGVTGYQLQYFKKGNSGGVRTVTVSGGKNTQIIAGLDRKSVYYVRVRAYKTVGNRTGCGAWSPKLTARTT